MDMSYLRPLYRRPGPWASVYLDVTRAEENADHQIELRWRVARQTLEEQGADPATLDALSSAIADSGQLSGRAGLALFANGGEVVLAEPLPAPPPEEIADFGPLPHVMPLIAQRGEEVPYVVAEVHRDRADVTGLGVGGVERKRNVQESETFPIRKVQAGGWSHRRYQQAAEETWKRNAGDVAAAVAELASTVGAEVIVLAGEEHATSYTSSQLPERWRDRVVFVEGNKGEEGLDEATTIAVAEIADRHARAAIDRYQAQRGDGYESSGLADVVTRLQRGQVETVLLVNDASSTDTLWIGPDDPTLVSVDQFELRDSGVNDPRKVRADAALVRAIAATDADLVLVEPDEVPLTHGIGAVLRYRDGQTAAV
jgi:hypothetical protein